jgi:nucleotide-binding universal stress UspA family protein
MLNTLLIPVDDSNLVKKMIKKLPTVIDISDKTIYLVHVSDPYYQNVYSESALSEYYISEKAHKEMQKIISNAIFEKYKKVLNGAGKISCIHNYDDDIPLSILSAAKKFKVDAIVMASHRYKGIENVILGDRAHKVIVTSKLPVLIL